MRWVRAGLTALGLLVVVATATPVVRWWGLWLAGQWTDGSGKTLVVLTGSSLGSVVLGDSSYRRSVYAVLAEKAQGYDRIWITGGDGTEAPICRMMADVLVAHGVDRGKIFLETASKSTRDSAVNMARIAPAGPIVLLSSDYHMRRSVAVFRREGLEVRPMPTPDILKRYEHWELRWNAFYDLGLETVKFGYYWGRGWL